MMESLLPYPDPLRRIVLTGFMGAGKSTVGALLAARAGWRFFDADQVLVESEGLSVAEIFARVGEPGFRHLEERTIESLLRIEQAVISLGGGALESPWTRARLFSTPATHVVFLDAPLPVLLQRCRGESAVRPLLSASDSAYDLISERFHRRLEAYRQAHQTLATTDTTPSELVHLLMETLGPALAVASTAPPVPTDEVLP